MGVKPLAVLPIFALILAQSAAGQSPGSHNGNDLVSARRFVTRFYDWYVPRSAKDGAGPAWGPEKSPLSSALSPVLLSALRADLAAAKRSKDEIVSLDFDPFLNSQDPAIHYVVGVISRKGKSYLANVHSFLNGKPAVKPDVTVVLDKLKGKWRIENFRYPGNEDLLGILRKLKKERTK